MSLFWWFILMGFFVIAFFYISYVTSSPERRRFYESFLTRNKPSNVEMHVPAPIEDHHAFKDKKKIEEDIAEKVRKSVMMKIIAEKVINVKFARYSSKDVPIDFYCEEKNIGLLYLSPLEYIWTKESDISKDEFVRRKEMRASLIKKHIERGMKIIVVPFHVSDENMESFIKSCYES